MREQVKWGTSHNLIQGTVRLLEIPNHPYLLNFFTLLEGVIFCETLYIHSLNGTSTEILEKESLPNINNLNIHVLTDGLKIKKKEIYEDQLYQQPTFMSLLLSFTVIEAHTNNFLILKTLLIMVLKQLECF